MNLRKLGHTLEKKYIELNEEYCSKITDSFHSWQLKDKYENYKNIKEFCYSAFKLLER